MASTEPAQPDTDAGGLDGGRPGAGRSPVLSRPPPTPRPRIELCPYCGRESVNTTRCSTCGGRFDALSRQATQNAMGPWWLRDGDRPIKPGCSYETIRTLVVKGAITGETVLRGPTTRQFWMRARRVPGVAHLLGACHSCQREVSPQAFMCPSCGASFNTETDRQHLGLSPVSLLPGQAGADRIAAVSAASVPIPPQVVIEQPVDRVQGSPSAGRGSGLGAPTEALAWSLGDHVALGLGREDGPVRARRGRGSIGAAVGMMVVGAIAASGAVWLVLLRTQGSVAGALAAVGLGDQGLVVATGDGAGGRHDAGALALDRATRAPEGTVGPASAEASVQTPGAGEPVAGVAPSGDEAEPTVAARGSEGAGGPGVGERGGLARLRDALARGQWREAMTLVGEFETSGALTPQDAATWRLAIEARVSRADLGGLP